ncbi:DNA polymerase IV [Alteribacillus sp. HJP-4]|uniref:DNA polymerase IV n=1 Tax=Alteribacillus sp. HJP-4 TaxID=2775394 RepID=UPI0035CD079B
MIIKAVKGAGLMQMQSWKGKVIFHIDMNSFYASVERLYDPALKGKPLAIAGNPKERRGIVVTASYEARAKGVKTTMPVWEALKKCPELIIRPPDFIKYRAASQRMFEYLENFTDLVEPVSIDEGYMDMTAAFKEGAAVDLAAHIQNRLYREQGLPCSIGVAPNKFLAKMASDMKKPMGITVLRKRELPLKLWPLPIEEMHGVGEKTAAKLKEWNITTIGGLAQYSESSLYTRFGIMGSKLYQRANGEDFRDVNPEAANETKSVGSSTTLPYDEDQFVELKKVIYKLAEKVEERMKRKQVCAPSLQIQIRYSDRKNVSRRKKLQNPVKKAADINREALVLFNKYWTGTPVRLLGITGAEVIPLSEEYKQLDLFSYEKDIKEAKLDKTLKELSDKYGTHTLRRGNRNDTNS